MPSFHRQFDKRLCIASSILVFVGIVRGVAQTRIIPQSAAFANPQRVTILGYDGDAMEPFISTDGRLLFFNSLNDPKVVTKIYWAKRINDITFALQGSLDSVNTASLQGTPSLDKDNNLFFISPRAYDSTLSTVWSGRFKNGGTQDIALVSGVSPKTPGIADTDADVSHDGRTLIVTEATFKPSGSGSYEMGSCKLVFFERVGRSFRRVPASDFVMRNVNKGKLNYAGNLSPDGLTLFFTRALSWPQIQPGIYIATRPSRDQPFSVPAHISAIDGFAEAPSVSPDGNAMYYHTKSGDKFSLYRVSRR